VKHQLIKKYLQGWFPKLGFWNGRILYFDTHAGKGKHKEGQIGSPLVAIDTLLKHNARDKILKSCEVSFVLIEDDPDNVNFLRAEVKNLGELPRKMSVHISHGDSFEQLKAILLSLNENSTTIAPSFIFVDPYGFKVPGKLLRGLLQAGRTEIFSNIIWRELDMAIIQAIRNPETGLTATLDLIFGSRNWIEIDIEADINSRAEQAISIMQDLFEAKWVTTMRMLGANGSIRYILSHFTNHEAGRDLMKDVMWKICPDGNFYARRSDNPNQGVLIQPNPDLRRLEEWLTDLLRKKPRHWSELKELSRHELWRSVHLSEVIREQRKKGEIIASDYQGKFSEKANPLLSLNLESR